MFSIWTPVKVITEGHAREGQAGTVQALDPENHPDASGVKFDLDGQLEYVENADLRAL